MALIALIFTLIGFPFAVISGWAPLRAVRERRSKKARINAARRHFQEYRYARRLNKNPELAKARLEYNKINIVREFIYIVILVIFVNSVFYFAPEDINDVAIFSHHALNQLTVYIVTLVVIGAVGVAGITIAGLVVELARSIAIILGLSRLLVEAAQIKRSRIWRRRAAKLLLKGAGFESFDIDAVISRSDQGLGLTAKGLHPHLIAPKTEGFHVKHTAHKSVFSGILPDTPEE